MHIMNKTLVILISLVWIPFGCSNGSSPPYNKDDIAQLKSVDYASFFGSNQAIKIEDINYSLFKEHPGYSGGFEIYENKRRIRLAMFLTNKDAHLAFELRQKDVASVFHKGAPKDNYKYWWYVNNLPAALSILHRNMIIDISINDAQYSAVENELWAVANTITNNLNSSPGSVRIKEH